MDQKEKLWRWKYGLFGLTMVGIGNYLTSNETAIVEGTAVLLFLMISIKDWKRLDKFDITGRACMIISGILAFSVMSGILKGIPLPIWFLSAFALIGIGIVLLWWSAHLKNPEKVSKKRICIVAGVMILVFVYWSILFMLRYHFY